MGKHDRCCVGGRNSNNNNNNNDNDKRYRPLCVIKSATRKAILFGTAFPIETHRDLKFGEKVSVEVLNSLILEIKTIKNPHTAL